LQQPAGTPGLSQIANSLQKRAVKKIEAAKIQHIPFKQIKTASTE